MSVRVLPRPEHVLRADAYTFRLTDGTPVPGIGIFAERRLIQHLTPEQAVALADQLVDATERKTDGY